MKTERLYLKEYFPQLGENGCNAYMDCYIPNELTETELDQTTYPSILVCPGGAYWYTSDREAEPIALQFVGEGYRVFVLRYSTVICKFPQQLREVAGAMELIHRNAKEWNCDINNIAILGFSAGGHLACQYSNRYNCPEIREVFPESKPVQKAILSYPVITADTRFSHADSMYNLLGHAPESLEDEGCSCELIVTEQTPPTFIWHTAEDASVPVENSLLYASALSAKNIPFELHIYPYGGHGMATVDHLTCKGLSEKAMHAHRWMEDCKKWLKITDIE